MVSRRRLLRLGAASSGLVGAALLAACGGSGASSVGRASTAATVSLASGAATATVDSLSAPATTSLSASIASGTATEASRATTTPATQSSSVVSTTTAAPVSAAARTTAAGVTVEWWSGWGTGGNAAKTLNQVAAAANQLASGYRVQHDAQSSAAKKLTAAIAAGTPPDMETGNLPYTQYWAQGLAEPLDSYLAKSTTVKKTDLFAASWKYGSYNGKTYGIPAVEAFVRWGLAANQDLLASRNLDATKVPTTWDDLLDWHKKLTVIDPGSKAIRQLGIDPLNGEGNAGSGGDPFFWGPAYGFTYYDENTKQFNLVNTQHEEALTTMKSFYDVAGGYDAVQTFRKTNQGGTGAKAGIVVGTDALYMDGYWVPGELTKLVPSKQYAYSWAPVSPVRNGIKMQSGGGHFAVLPKGSPHPDAAFALSEFLTTDPAQQIVYDGIGWIGARPSFLAKIDTTKYPGLDFYVTSATTAKEFLDPVACPIDDFFIQTWQDQVNKLLQSKVTAHDAIQQMQQLCTAQMQQLKS